MAVTEFGRAFSTEYYWVAPIRNWFGHCSRRCTNTRTVLRINLGHKGRSPAHFTWHLSLHAASDLLRSDHDVFRRARVCPKSVWLFRHVRPDSAFPDKNQDRRGYADRGIWGRLSDVSGGNEKTDSLRLLSYGLNRRKETISKPAWAARAHQLHAESLPFLFSWLSLAGSCIHNNHAIS